MTQSHELLPDRTANEWSGIFPWGLHEVGEIFWVEPADEKDITETGWYARLYDVVSGPFQSSEEAYGVYCSC